MLTKNNTFDWSLYEDGYTGGAKLEANTKITGGDSKTKCFSREPYAQKLFDIYSGHSTPVVKKDLTRGDCVEILDIYNITDDVIDIEVAGGLSISIDLNREKRFIQIFGFTDTLEFTNNLRSDRFKSQLLDQKLLAYVIESTPNIKLSLWQGYLMGIREEFMEEITNPSKAYTAKVKEANKGGFFVEVQGIDAFMPGSLAAPNKINDFQSYVGQEVIVMIEDFLKDMNSFIVSHKKYIAYILPQKLTEIDMMVKHEGIVTGTSKHGIFIEFGDSFTFTGLLHISKMSPETKIAFSKREYKPGDPIDFFIGEITKDNRIVLTEEDPIEKLSRIQNFIIDSQDKVIKARIAAVMQFGIIINIGDITGLIPAKEFKRNRTFINNFVVNDDINVKFGEFKDNKLVFLLAKN